MSNFGAKAAMIYAVVGLITAVVGGVICSRMDRQSAVSDCPRHWPQQAGPFYFI